MPHRHPSAGYSLLELLSVLVLLGLLSALAVPSLQAAVQRIRVRGVLHRVGADLYRARALAARSGREVVLRFDGDPAGCVRGWAIEDPAAGRSLRVVELAREAPGVCVSVSGSATLRVNARGMPNGAARKVRARLGSAADSLSVSLVGRVYHWSFVVLLPPSRWTGNCFRSRKHFRTAVGFRRS